VFLRLLQISCVLLLIAVMVSVKSGLIAIAEWGGPGFDLGAIFGFCFAVAVYGLICWVDPSSRPRGRS
jgi:hypothetical protein